MDAASFVVSLLTLVLIRTPVAPRAGDDSLTAALAVGLRFVAHAPSLRYVVFVIMAINFLVVGPFTIGLPTLAYARLPEGADAYGIIMSAMGGGALLGMAAGAVLRPLPAARLGPAIIVILASTGIGVAVLSLVTTTAVAFAIVLFLGAQPVTPT